MSAADIMTRKVVTVRPDSAAGTVARLLLDHHIGAVPVIDDDNRVIGIVSQADLLGRPAAGSPRAWWLRLFSDKVLCLEEIANAAELTASDVMTRRVVTISQEAPIALVAGLMHRHRMKCLPVVRDGRLVGIVSRGDLLKGLVQGRETATTW